MHYASECYCEALETQAAAFFGVCADLNHHWTGGNLFFVLGHRSFFGLTDGDYSDAANALGFPSLYFLRGRSRLGASDVSSGDVLPVLDTVVELTNETCQLMRQNRPRLILLAPGRTLSKSQSRGPRRTGLKIGLKMLYCVRDRVHGGFRIV